ncbi:MAG: endo-1,4-beta-xylanase [Fuerstiella sp.]
MKFRIETEHLVPSTGVATADFVTFDGRIIPTVSKLNGNLLECTRSQTDSSKLRILCNLGDRRTIVQTTSLPEAPEPYNLETELARGELSRLRHFYHLWTGSGLRSTDALDLQVARAHERFRSGVFGADAAAVCLEAIHLTHQAMDLLGELYTRQRITYRQQRTQRFPMFVGCRLVQPPVREQYFLDAFNSVMIATRWADLEPRDGDYSWERLDQLVDWAIEHRLFAIGGPLLDLSTDAFPDWITPWKSDPLNLECFVSDFVETVVSRYVGRIRHWEVVSGANCGGVGDLTEEQRLNLVVRAIEAAQQVDEQIQISLRVIQPWGEYLGAMRNRLPPIQFIDTLRRSGAKVSEVNLEIRFGTSPLCSLHRDILGISQLLDHWSMLQLPVNVMASLPEPTETLDFISRVQWQIEQMDDFLLMCLSKERVTGFYCLNWADRTAPDEPLVDPENSLHPVVSDFSALERTHWPATGPR